MKLLFDFFPIILFFLTYKLYGIYAATGIAVIASFIQVALFRIKYNRFDTMQLVSLAIIALLGGATLYLQNPWFIKWKPTGIYWLASIVFFFSSLFNTTPLIKKMMGSNIKLKDGIWLRLNYAWGVFFLLMGALNLYIAFYYSTDTWVNFKLFGGLGLTLLFVFIQALWLTRHLDDRSFRPTSSRDSTRP
ncbi:septation protein A [Legionella sp. W05-934-2]|uniref:septation protein A n=1 Tax=Legionella sp. W05-934-2 TaxID=1198649 RepID=UPI0034628B24